MNLLVSLLLLNVLPAPRPAVLPADSIGQEMRGGQRLVRHRVTAGETLYGIARHYRVTADQLTTANPQLKNGLGIGAIVLVPRGPAGGAAPVKTTAATAPPVATPAAAPASVPARHTVAKGETLFGIARRYNVSPATITQLNGLPDGSGVRVGQELLLRPAEGGAPTPAPVAAAPAPRPAAAPVTPRPEANKEAVVATVTPAPEKEKTATREPDETRAPSRASEVIGRKTEDGIGALIENNGTDKYLALHKTAPVGTIMQVRNAMNGQSVYVRVIGQLPDTGENQNVLVRLSPRAVAKLGTADARFRVETSYIP